jgi:hypothetical protein
VGHGVSEVSWGQLIPPFPCAVGVT